MWREEAGITEMLFTYIGEYQAFCGWSSWRSVVIDILTCHEAARRQRIALACGSIEPQELGIVSQGGMKKEAHGRTADGSAMCQGVGKKHKERMVKDELLEGSFELVMEGAMSPETGCEAWPLSSGLATTVRDEENGETKSTVDPSSLPISIPVHQEEELALPAPLNLDSSVSAPHHFPADVTAPTGGQENEHAAFADLLRLRCSADEMPTTDPQMLPTSKEMNTAAELLLYSCNVCGKKFNSIYNTLSHERSHYPEHSRGHVTIGRQQVEKPRLTCSYCSKTFTQKCQKILHERSHTGEKPFSCSFCPKSFSQNSDKLRHERCHTGERPYSCRFCSKAFTQRGHQREHERIHTGEKRHTCRICFKAFSYKLSRNKHELCHKCEIPNT